ncbi:MAG: cobalamin biosynthesis protein CbiM [Desulfitibacter sp. BRH_c19]|nr:MAG: cobalamin biosynthesis protein CbiM [Desulfitibacter sp. BRH_c19]
MHMADALISPVVGVTMLAATAGVAAYSVKKLKDNIDEQKIPLMGVMGAFIFAVQMINFAIPGTGSSGHLGGGMLLAILLGPYAGFLTMISILSIQALFFADGGLLALGANSFNLGFFTCFVGYLLIYRPIMSKGYSSSRLFMAIMLSAVIALQLGAFSVVLQTLFSGKTELPFTSFVLLMQPIHFAIGIIEGLVTATVVSFVWKSHPELIERTAGNGKSSVFSIKKTIAAIAIAAVLIGAVFSWFASEHPDGLEWAIYKVSGTEELEAQNGIHKTLESIQEKVAFLPDYSFKSSVDNSQEESEVSASIVDAGTSIAGLVGGLITLLAAGLLGYCLHTVKRRRQRI